MSIEIQDALKEIIAYTHSLGFLELVKVTGAESSTELTSTANDRAVLLKSKFLQPVTDFSGVFGLHNLGLLDTILTIPEYQTGAVIKVKTSNNIPSSITFTNAAGDFHNEYRFMSKEIIESQLPTKTRKEIHWDVSVGPSVNAIQRLKFQSQAVGNTVKTFKARTEDGNLIFSLGDNSNTGEFVFQSGVSGSIGNPHEWSIQKVQGILNLVGNKTLDISDMGAMQITVTSGLAIHQFTIAASLQ
ncbi:Uncharacterised protein [uncultured archaeon]|nr:Uncharacterised protein [uncultured archaeon]